VVFSGDQLNGQKTSYDARSVTAKFTKPVIDREIPWCAIFGNHDSEIAEDREEQMRALQSLPYSLAQSGPKEVDGFGNCESSTRTLNAMADDRLPEITL
jgi:DNA repair exonuclease SbcCD nuclease subunit